MPQSAFDNPRSDDFYIKADVYDAAWTVDAIRETYWGSHRTPGQLLLSFRHSLCFGLYEHVIHEGGDVARDRQVGFARVITDFATFSELVDVVVDPACRGRGLGKFLVRTVLNDPRISRTVVNLSTRDAHTFYEALGFKRVEKMKRIPHQTGA